LARVMIYCESHARGTQQLTKGEQDGQVAEDAVPEEREAAPEEVEGYLRQCNVT